MNLILNLTCLIDIQGRELYLCYFIPLTPPPPPPPNKKQPQNEQEKCMNPGK